MRSRLDGAGPKQPGDAALGASISLSWWGLTLNVSDPDFLRLNVPFGVSAAPASMCEELRTWGAAKLAHCTQPLALQQSPQTDFRTRPSA